jgi:hypothetical protein
LEEACWNGMLSELLPEVIQRTVAGNPLYLWHIRCEEAYLQISLSEFPVRVDKYSSINTDFFLPVIMSN